MTIKVTNCPTCAGGRIRKVRRNWKGIYRCQTYVVPALEFYECPDCGEEVYDHDAMRRIEARCPAYPKLRTAAAR